jgi:Taurine catabolism dioxygenase TauD, TfdA family
MPDLTPLDLPPPQTGPAAWRGPECAARGDWLTRLAPEQIDELEAATHGVLAAGVPLARLTAADFPLPALGPWLAGLRAELLRGRGFALLRGLPVARFSRQQLAAIFLGIGAHLGRARSQNAAGHLLGHVCDLGLSSTDPNVRIYQTHERQTFHTDSCDVVGLLCLREARRGGDSLLVSALTIFNELRATRPDLLARLLAPMAHDRRGEVPAGAQPFFMIPVFSWLPGQGADGLTVFYQRQYFDSAQRFADAPRLTALDVEALDAFDALANDPRLNLSMRLMPGDMQFVHNHVLLHDRTAFEDGPQPSQRRHLLRLWLACPGARVLPPAFAARYGSIEIGDRGGIVVPGTGLCVPLEPPAV